MDSYYPQCVPTLRRGHGAVLALCIPPLQETCHVGASRPDIFQNTVQKSRQKSGTAAISGFTSGAEQFLAYIVQ